MASEGSGGECGFAGGNVRDGRVDKDARMLKIGVLISGSGTNLQAIIDEIAGGDEFYSDAEYEEVDARGPLPVEIVHVLSSRPDAFGIERAKEAGIPVTVLNRDIYSDPIAADQIIVDTMQSAGAEYIVMAGYMRKLTHVVLDAFPDKVLNLHPALLPSFKGAHAIRDAWDAGVKVTGVTVHLANEDYDKGPIIAQRAVEVFEYDTIESLEERIHEVEHRLYPMVLRIIAEGRMSIDDNRKVHIE